MVEGTRVGHGGALALAAWGREGVKSKWAAPQPQPRSAHGAFRGARSGLGWGIHSRGSLNSSASGAYPFQLCEKVCVCSVLYTFTNLNTTHTARSPNNLHIKL